MGCPSATRMPFDPFLNPSESRIWLALVRSNGSGLIDESCQCMPLVIDDGGTMVLPGEAYPSQAVETICALSIAYSNAIRTLAFRSSLCSGFLGLELMMKSLNSRDGPIWTWIPAALAVLTDVGGRCSIASSWPDFNAVTMASGFWKNWRPNSSR